MIEVGRNSKITFSNGDMTPMCPHCAYTKSDIIGNLSVSGASQSLYKCEACNALYTKAEGGFHDVIKEAETTAGGIAGITFTGSTTTTMPIIHTGMGGAGGGSASDYHSWSSNSTINTMPLEAKIDEDAMKEAITNGFRNAIGNKLDDLIDRIDELLIENQRLQTQLACDPLIGLRDKINNFNLK